jgi:hypothetical protein
MSDGPDRFTAAVERFDAANAQDPNTTLVDSRPQPKELVYAQRMTGWLQRLHPEASEPLRLAARAQHLCRWMIPRSSYPMTRPGYIQWRTELGRFHADKAGQILREAGYDEPTVQRVQSLLRKEQLKNDPEAQALEDVICLVFLEHYFAEFAEQHEEEKVIGIVRKTWRKMSTQAHAAALELDLPTSARGLIERALDQS